MPALNAIRLNPEFKAKYEAMVKVRKTRQGSAIVAIAEKAPSSSPTPSSVIGENGPPLSLDQHGHYRGRLKNDRSPAYNGRSIASA